MEQNVKKIDMATAQAIVSDMQMIKMLCVQAQSYSDCLGTLKFRYQSVSVDLEIFPEHISELWDWPLSASSLEQFHTRALRFARMAEAHAIWLATNVEG
ncbi:hypothetical protein CSG01_042 [Cronobacter phage SG01]|uniref:Uncharacterized protein n=1 Tax=Cronobacter phage CS01 TaxID=2496544 RepID=A0A3B8DJG5_9CAUD|nr:hypothetical protein HOU43_gp46 [Cronobacter phage CS01]AYJ73334.1 hypothetical protein CS01_046 [Cronobacter phage CS01]WDS30466.1 hypothetical protein CSG01_042 [Cronobacter phage SG01]